MQSTTAQLDQYVTQCNNYQARILRLISMFNDDWHRKHSISGLNIALFCRTDIMQQLGALVSNIDSQDSSEILEDRDSCLDIINGTRKMIKDADNIIRARLDLYDHSTIPALQSSLKSFIIHSTNVMINIIAIVNEKFVIGGGDDHYHNGHVGRFYVHKMSIASTGMINAYRELLNLTLTKPI